ncbi:MAG: RNA polymerase sigma factor [Pyrinomonadaceae bacterium]|nr:RNA polymerase sigma factor [Pyrinomonadaceae bacterium]
MRQEVEKNLIDQSRAGDADAFSEIYSLLKDSIYGFAYRMTNEQPIAEEITQEVFIFFIENPDKYDSKQGRLFSFLCGVARNKALNHLKKSGTRLEANSLDEERIESLAGGNGNSPVNNVLDQEFSEKIEECVAQLSPFQKEVLILRELEDLSYEEIARITDTSVGVIKGRLHRARQTLAKILAPYIEGKEVLYEVHRS